MTISGRVGPFQDGERVALVNPKGNRRWISLKAGQIFHTTKGGINHDDIIGQPDGSKVCSAGGMEFLVFRPLMQQFMVSMPREAAVIYPKDAAQIIMFADIFPGARVLEAGAGSGALSLAILRAIGPNGRLVSYERRPDFAEVAQANVETFLGPQSQWHLVVGDLVESLTAESDQAGETFDRVVLDMLAPWECVEVVAAVLSPGGVFCGYVTTTTQMSRLVDQLRADGSFTEPTIQEVMIREWQAEGLAVRPAHGTTGHTGFIVIARHLPPGVTPPLRRRRPAPGAYGPDFDGPMPKNLIIGDGSFLSIS